MEWKWRDSGRPVRVLAEKGRERERESSWLDDSNFAGLHFSGRLQKNFAFFHAQTFAAVFISERNSRSNIKINNNNNNCMPQILKKNVAWECVSNAN
uniref:RE06388p n=1 Tax=Drosophila melanogaster TaxID=7227 RepID=Q8SZC4_DROME|nr:RE06388p [Drosophila melanogaster]